MIYCKKKLCGKEEDELHHIIPICIGGTDEDGRRYLCKKHHDILHKMITEWIWRFVPEKDRKKCKKFIQKMTEWWINKEDKK